MGPAELDSIPKPPYQGQGEPLPSELNLDGDWIIDGQLLLARIPANKSQALVFAVHLGEGRYCEGIDANMLVGEIDAIPDADTLIEMNRDKCLAVSMVNTAPAHGAKYGIFFTIVTPWGGCRFRASAAQIN
jgi:hypothetical protein